MVRAIAPPRDVVATPMRFLDAATLSGELVGRMWSTTDGELFMTSLALPSPSSALKEGVLTSKIRARIAEYVGIDVEYINHDSDLSVDFGLDLLDVMELLILLEDIFLDGRLTNEADEIEVVGDLIRHIEQHSAT